VAPAERAAFGRMVARRPLGTQKPWGPFRLVAVDCSRSPTLSFADQIGERDKRNDVCLLSYPLAVQTSRFIALTNPASSKLRAQQSKHQWRFTAAKPAGAGSASNGRMCCPGSSGSGARLNLPTRHTSRPIRSSDLLGWPPALANRRPPPLGSTLPPSLPASLPIDRAFALSYKRCLRLCNGTKLPRRGEERTSRQ